MAFRPAVVALAVALAAGALFALGLGRIGSSAEEEANRPAETQRLGAAAPTTATRERRRRRTPADDARESRVRVPSWPRRAEAHTVVLFAAAERREAESRARGARAAGIPAGVLRSDDYATLEPGFWIVFAGRFDGEDPARAAAESYGGLGYANGYVAFVSASGDAGEDN